MNDRPALNEPTPGFGAEQFRLLADHVPALIACYDAETRRCQFANRAYAQTFGWTEQAILGRTFGEVIGEGAAQEIRPHVDEVLLNRRAVSYERQLTDAQGAPRWLAVHLLPHLGLDGRPVACFVLISDVTPYRRSEAALRESEDRLTKFMQASVEGIVFHRNGLITDANPPLLAMTGYALDDMLGRHVLSFIPDHHVARVQAVMGAGEETRYELDILCKDGRELPVEFIVRTMVWHGEPTRMTIVRDMRDRRSALARIHHLAHHDALTGLPNRHAFMDRLKLAMAEAQRQDRHLALLFIDLDHFKRINDSLGHLVGDSLLQSVADRLQDALRSNDLVARFGGDEFMVLLDDLRHADDVAALAQQVLQAVQAPLDMRGRSISITPSIGVAVYPQHGKQAAELIKHADTAMYVAKTRGRALVQFFEPDMAQRADEALLLESQLTLALARDELLLHYQPKLRCADRRLVGAEALIRWRHPERGLLLPDSFIGLAEQQPLMHRLGHWALQQALADARRRRDRQPGLAPVPVAVNLSSIEFHAPDLVERVQDALAEAGLGGEWLELELTERVLMDDIPATRRKLARLKRLGLRIAVDDFGTGYSSLGHLKDLPVDRLKIDRSFVRDLPGDPGSLAIARAIVHLAHSLGLVVTAEGVETQAQAQALQAMGCDEWQGLLVAPPLGAEEWAGWSR
jgi:diguanylate cyclase (GGDEF)-like protein/PAS domain S-box-containing protein